MPYNLMNREVAQDLWNQAEMIRKRSGKAFLVTPGELPDKARELSHCLNCEGTGLLGLQTFVGGPYNTAAGHKHVTEYGGKWYVQETKFYTCPVCNGAGVSKPAKKPDKLSF